MRKSNINLKCNYQSVYTYLTIYPTHYKISQKPKQLHSIPLCRRSVFRLDHLVSRPPPVVTNYKHLINRIVRGIMVRT